MSETTLFTVKSITQHFGKRAKITFTREGNNVGNESFEISFTLEEAKVLHVGSTYSFHFIVADTKVGE